MARVRLLASLCSSLCLFVCLFFLIIADDHMAGVRAQSSSAWLKIVGASDTNTQSGGGGLIVGGVIATYASRGWDAADISHQSVEELQSVADDFEIPVGKTATKLMIALQAIRSFSPTYPLNPDYVRFGILHHNSTTNAPDHWRPALLWVNITAPAGDWNNMTVWTERGVDSSTYSGRDWFEIDVSSVNNSQGLSSGKYWVVITAFVRQYKDKAPCCTYSAWNSYHVIQAFGEIGVSGNQGFGSPMLLPTSSSCSCQAYFINDLPLLDRYGQPSNFSFLSWTKHSSCLPGVVCDLSMNVYAWCNSDGTEANIITTTLPPPVCYELNAAQTGAQVWDCPSVDFAIVGTVPPSTAVAPSTTISGATGSPVVITSAPVSTSPNGLVSGSIPVSTSNGVLRALVSWVFYSVVMLSALLN